MGYGLYVVQSKSELHFTVKLLQSMSSETTSSSEPVAVSLCVTATCLFVFGLPSVIVQAGKLLSTADFLMC
jgi:hypothetical protein